MSTWTRGGATELTADYGVSGQMSVSNPAVRGWHREISEPGPVDSLSVRRGRVVA
jgi:hypothetical protein